MNLRSKHYCNFFISGLIGIVEIKLQLGEVFCAPFNLKVYKIFHNEFEGGNKIMIVVKNLKLKL
jgi:hypothetical protein